MNKNDESGILLKSTNDESRAPLKRRSAFIASVILQAERMMNEAEDMIDNCLEKLIKEQEQRRDKLNKLKRIKKEIK